LPSLPTRRSSFRNVLVCPIKQTVLVCFKKCSPLSFFLIGHSHTRIELSLALGLGSIPSHPLVTSRPRVPRLFYDDLEKKRLSIKSLVWTKYQRIVNFEQSSINCCDLGHPSTFTLEISDSDSSQI
jgi:hypothetical protein